MKEITEILNSRILSGFTGTPEGHNGGKWVKKLEEDFRKYIGAKHAIAVNSATAGLHAAMISCDIGRGDEVIVTPYSFSSSASCALMVGAVPVFADIDENTFCMSIEAIKKKITSKTKAIVVVHLFGQSADMHSIITLAKKHGIEVIEDCAQAIGATYRGRKVGRIGDCGIFSFNQSKTINAGEGGMVITNHDDVARVIRAVRNHGEVSDPQFEIVGYNYRLNEIEAYLVWAQLQYLDEVIEGRYKCAEALNNGLPNWIIKPKFTDRHALWAYPIRIIDGSRDEILEKLQENGVPCDRYVEPLYNLPLYRQFGYEKGMCPIAERMWEKEMLRLDMGRLTFSQIGFIIKTIIGG